MLENLLTLIKQHAGPAIIDNPAIPNDQNDTAISMAGHSIMDGLKNMLTSGKTGDVVNLFNNPGADIASTPAAQQISGGFMQSLMSKFGLGQNEASGIASGIIPEVLQRLVHKTNDPADSSFNLQGILSQLTGGGTGGLDLQGLMNKFTGSATGGGGIGDAIKGFMGK
jgi:hypothetical protein